MTGTLERFVAYCRVPDFFVEGGSMNSIVLPLVLVILLGGGCGNNDCNNDNCDTTTLALCLIILCGGCGNNNGSRTNTI